MIIARVRRQRLAVHPTRRILAESIRWYRDNILLRGFRDISLNHRFVLVTLLDNRWQFKIKWTPSIKFQMEGQGRSTCLSASDRGLWKWTGRLGSQLAKTRSPFLGYWAFNNFLLVKIMSHTKEFEFFFGIQSELHHSKMTMFANDMASYCHENSPNNLQSKLNADLAAILHLGYMTISWH